MSKCILHQISVTPTDNLQFPDWETWSKAKQKAAKKASDVAAELLEIYAKRAAQKGESFQINKQDYQEFADSFPFRR